MLVRHTIALCGNFPRRQDRHSTFRPDFEALRRHVDAGSAMDFERAEPWLQRIATELNCETWMTIAGDGECPIATHRGSRPGSSWADLMFGLLVKRLLLRRDSILDRQCEPAEDWAPTLVWDGCRSFATTASETAAGSRQVPFGDQIWADDLATPLSSSVAARLPARWHAWLEPCRTLLLSTLWSLPSAL